VFESAPIYPWRPFGPRNGISAFLTGLLLGCGYVLWASVRSTRKPAATSPAHPVTAANAPTPPLVERAIELSREDELVLEERRQGYVAATIADRLGLTDARVRASLRRLRKAGYPV
jgi:hypothetical protein